MTDALLELVPVWGPWLLAAVTFGSCLALPLPASLMVLTAGGLAAGGDMALLAVFAAAVGGALLGDQTAYALGRAGGRPLVMRFAHTRPRQATVARAEVLVHRHGLVGVYLSRWLFSPLAPYVCYLAGAARMAHRRFSAASVAGEVTWAGIYTTLGFVFAESVAQIGAALGNVTAGLTAALLVVLGLLAVRAMHRRRVDKD